TMVILLSLQILGYLETTLNLKSVSMTYEVKGARPEEVLDAVNDILDEARHPMQAIKVGSVGEQSRVLFTLLATRKEHDMILIRLKGTPTSHSVSVFPSALNECPEIDLFFPQKPPPRATFFWWCGLLICRGAGESWRICQSECVTAITESAPTVWS